VLFVHPKKRGKGKEKNTRDKLGSHETFPCHLYDLYGPSASSEYYPLPTPIFQLAVSYGGQSPAIPIRLGRQLWRSILNNILKIGANLHFISGTGAIGG
jgi:hypothetical protein